MKNKKYYESKFAEYPDLVTIPTFCEMLGGIAKNTARKLIRENRIKYFYIRCTYYIPKAYIIAYLLSDDYAEYKKKLKVRV